jgi:nicotinamidase-related amidase
MKTLGKKVIFESLQEIVDPEHTALLLWDCQNELVSKSFNRYEYLANLKALLDTARRYKLPVIYSKINQAPLVYQSSWSIYMNMRRFHVDDPAKLSILKPGSPQAEISVEIAPIEGEAVIHRPAASIFFGTDFEQWLRNRGVQTLLITGVSTEIGVEHCARDAGVRGFYPVVVSDCVSSADKTMHEMALKIMSRLLIVMSSQEIMKVWAE